MTNDEYVIPSIGLRDALSKKEFVNKVPTIVGSNRDEVKFYFAFSDYLVTVDYSVGSRSLISLKLLLKIWVYMKHLIIIEVRLGK